MKEASMNVLYSKVREHRGAMNAIAYRAKCSRNWVRQVLKGEYFDETVISLALEEVKLREAKRLKLREQIIAMTASM